jgi:hypothetical protein
MVTLKGPVRSENGKRAGGVKAAEVAGAEKGYERNRSPTATCIGTHPKRWIGLARGNWSARHSWTRTFHCCWSHHLGPGGSRSRRCGGRYRGSPGWHGNSEYEAKRYEGRVKPGGILLSVHSDNSDWTKCAKEILQHAGAQDVASGKATSRCDAPAGQCNPVEPPAASPPEAPFFFAPQNLFVFLADSACHAVGTRGSQLSSQLMFHPSSKRN